MTAYTVKLKRSANAGGIPTTSDLALGELAVNTTDGKLFTKKSVNGTESIVTLGGSVWDASGTNIFATGKDLGLGVTSPLSVFHIKDDAARILFHNDNTGTAAGNGLLLGLGASNDANAYLMQQNNEHLHIGTNDTTRIFVKNDGKVGVNTESVIIGSRMDIHGGADANNIVGISGADQTSEYLGLGVAGGQAIITAGNSASGNTNLAFRTAPGGAEAVQMLLDYSGQLGVGTLDPVGPLHVKKATSTACRFILENSGSSSDDSTQIWSQNDELAFNTNDEERIRIDEDGLVGINTTEPQSLLSLQASSQPVLGLYTGTTLRAEFKATVSKTTILSSANSPIAFNIGGSGETEALTIAGNGAIGINETNPGNMLDINCGTQNNGIKLTSTDPGSYIQFVDNTTTGETRCGAVGNDYKIDVNSGERLRIGSGGDVAIGGGSITSITGYTVLALNNATQGGAIELKRNDVSYGRLLQGSNAVILESRQAIPLEFGINGAKKAFLSSGGTFSVIGGGSEASPAVSLNGSAASNSLIVTTGGNVAIGQATATAQLEVSGEDALVGSAYNYQYSTNCGIRVTGNEGSVDILSTDAGQHGGSVLLRGNNEGFGLVNRPDANLLEINSFTASANNFHVHGTSGSNLSSYKKIAAFRKDGGITFNGDTAAANALDDYEEGTWTPTIRENGTGTEWDTISNQVGTYTKVGQLVTVTFAFEYSARATNVNTGFYGFIAGLPFSNTSTTTNAGASTLLIARSGGSVTPYHIYLNISQGNTLLVYGNQDSASPGPLTTSEWPDVAAKVKGQLFYYVP